MGKSTFVKVWINGNDVSAAVESVRHERDFKKGEFVEIRCKSDRALDLANDKNLVAGAKIEYQYGLTGGVFSSVRAARIGNIDVGYDSDRVQLTIRATDKSIEIKKGGDSRVWTNTRLSDIVKQIGEGYGLNTERVEETKIIHKNLLQGHLSDWEFLTYLVIKEPEPLQLHVDGSDIVLEKNVRDRKSKRLFELGKNIISFRTSLKEITQKPPIPPIKPTLGSNDDLINQYGFTVNKGATMTKEIERGVQEWESQDGLFTVDRIKVVELRNGKKTVLSSKLVTSKIEQVTFVDAYKNVFRANVYMPYDPNEQKTVANGINNDRKQKVLTGDLTIELDPFLTANDIITLSLPVNRHNGNWYIEKAVHTVDSNGAITNLSLNKNGVSASVKVDKTVNEKVNRSVGETSTKQSTRVRYSGVSGLEVGENDGLLDVNKIKIN
ncbi:MAG: hypothetical protein JNL70_21800 [Saprospiraceae bacterium]|nr:hypothetical protein [Saprospiraceae bacterium]